MDFIIGLIVALGGSAGIASLWKAYTDHKLKVSAREEDAEERLVKRLEQRSIDADSKIGLLQSQLEDANRHILKLSVALSRAGIEIPEREDRLNGNSI